MIEINIHKKTTDFKTYRANRVKSLFNPEKGNTFELNAELDITESWSIGMVVGPSGTGKTSVGEKFFGANKIEDLYAGWSDDKCIVDDIAPDGDFNIVTGALAAVGLGDVPAWLRPFKALSNGQQFRAGLARVMCDDTESVVIDEFTSVVDRQIAKIGAMAFAKSWRRQKGRQVLLLACHYDIIDWVQPDWVLDTGTGKFVEKKTLPGNGHLLSSKFSRSMAVTGITLKRITI